MLLSYVQGKGMLSKMETKKVNNYLTKIAEVKMSLNDGLAELKLIKTLEKEGYVIIEDKNNYSYIISKVIKN